MFCPFKAFRQCFLVCFFVILLLSIVIFLQQGFSLKLVRETPLAVVKPATGQTEDVAWHVRLPVTRSARPPVKLKLPPATNKTTIFTTTTTATTTTTTMKKKTTEAPHLEETNPIPGKYFLKKMSEAELVTFYHSYVMSPRSTCTKVRRMGVVKDGGWEMCDDPLYRPDPRNCLVYSFGINYDFSYDDEMAKYGCEIHAFDPSMKDTRDHLRGQRVHFHPLGIGGSNGLHYVGKSVWQLYTLASHRQRLRHSTNQRRLDILKIDVEGHELVSMLTAAQDGSLLDVKQISLETHLSLGKNPQKEKYVEYLDLLRQLYDIGFRIYHTARNHVYSSFVHRVIDKQLVTCHEINMVNIRNKNRPPLLKHSSGLHRPLY